MAEAVNTDVPLTAEFSTSDTLFTRINEIWQRSQLDNMHGGIASDCPHRERSPYTGDGQVVCPTVMSNFGSAAFYKKWLRDMRDAQNVESGYVPNGAPWQPGCGGGVAWGAAMNVMPWEFYRYYGDIDELRDNYFAMKEQVRYMKSWETPRGTMYSRKGVVGSDVPMYWLNLGDWSPATGLPSDELVHTFYYWYCADRTARAARALGEVQDEKHTRRWPTASVTLSSMLSTRRTVVPSRLRKQCFRLDDGCSGRSEAGRGGDALQGNRRKNHNH